MRKIKLAFVAVFAVVSTGSVFSDVVGEWKSAELPSTLAGGALTFTYENDAVTSVVATPSASETITLFGDDLTFADGATVRFAAPGSLVISNNLAGTGAVSLENAISVRTLEYDGALLRTNAWTKMFSGVSLSAYRPVKSIRRNGDGVFDTGVYYPYNVTRRIIDGAEEMSIQLMSATASSTRFIRMRLRQNGDDIDGIVDGASYLEGRCVLGEDIEKLLARNEVSPEPGFLADYYVHTPLTSGGYGVCDFFMEQVQPVTVAIAGSVASTLQFSLSGSGLSVAASTGTLSTQVSGSGTLALASAASGAENPCADGFAGFITGTAVTISSNRRLTTLTNVTAKMSGSSVGGNRYPATFCQMHGGSHCVTGELQMVHSGERYNWRYATIVLTQNGEDVKASVIDIGFISRSGEANVDWFEPYFGKRSVYDAEFDADRHNLANTSWLKIATADNSAALGVCDFSFMYDRPSAESIELTSTFVNGVASPDRPASVQYGHEDAMLRIAGTDSSRMLAKVADGATAVFPQNGVVEVATGGELRLGGRSAISSNSALIRVLSGGVLRASNSTSMQPAQQVILDGGEFVMRDDKDYSLADPWTYMNLLTLRDGARVSGTPIRIGSSGTASWRVAGTSASTCETSLILCSVSAGATKEVVLSVADVTDDEASDFILEGDINTYATQNNVSLRKTGGGTLAHCGRFGNTNPSVQAVRVEAGTWLLDGSDSSAQAFELAGGCMAAAAGTDNSAGALSVSAAGTIRADEGGTLAFADSSAATWSAGVRVQVDADLDSGAIRFGTSAAALTEAQLACLRFGRNRVILDSDGYLRDAGDSGFVIIVR